MPTLVKAVHGEPGFVFALSPELFIVDMTKSLPLLGVIDPGVTGVTPEAT